MKEKVAGYSAFIIVCIVFGVLLFVNSYKYSQGNFLVISPIETFVYSLYFDLYMSFDSNDFEAAFFSASMWWLTVIAFVFIAWKTKSFFEQSASKY